ncbi:hypothetical protein VKT23_019359 [Stygiomarasmius scandens]|uniref:Cytochrome P450 n=1 Tax=Marasmiellus scandens TaxID=2682957 RepID=A0ABR1ILM5_9AGAR
MMQAIYNVVWQETTHALTRWFSEVDSNSQSSNEISIHTAQSFTKLALLTFLRAGFGELDTPQNDLYTVLKDTFHYSAARAIIPEWLFSLTNRVYIPFISSYLRKTLKAYDDLETISMHAVSRTRADLLEGSGKKTPQGGALLRNLVEANMNIDEENRSENDKRSLTDRELLSNIFIFFLAGYGNSHQQLPIHFLQTDRIFDLETTANAVSFACALLALYPEIQKKVFEEVSTLWPEGLPIHAEEKEYKQCFSKLTYTTAVFHETIRFQPIVSRLGRKVLRDIALKTYRFEKGVSSDSDLEIQPITIPLKEGSEIIIDVHGVHRNRKLHFLYEIVSFILTVTNSSILGIKRR